MGSKSAVPESIKKAAVTQLAKMQQSQVAISLHLMMMKRFQDRRQYGYTDLNAEDVRKASGVIFGALSDIAQRDATDALLFAELAGDSAIKAQAVEILWGWLMSDSAGVMQFFEISGLSPGQYAAAVSAELHTSIRNQLRPLLPEKTPYPDNVELLQGMVGSLETKVRGLEEEIDSLHAEIKRIKAT